MRFTSIDLRRFGRFDDVLIELSTAAGMHVVLGRNEAGKSTLLDGVTYALHGMPQGRSAEPTYDFQHGKSALRVGVGMQLDDGGGLRVLRKRGNKHTLLDPDSDAPDAVREQQLIAALAGVPKDVWRMRHGITRQRLRQGASAMLESGGEATDALMSADAGVGIVREVLHDVREQRRALLADSGKKGELHDAVKAHEQASKELREARADASGFDDLHARLGDVRRELSSVAMQRAATDARIQQLDAARDAASQLDERERLTAQRDETPAPAAPWTAADHEAFTRASDTLDAATARIGTFEQQLAEASALRDGLVVDATLLDREEIVTALLQRIELVTTTRAMLPELEAASTTARAALQAAASAAGITSRGADPSLDDLRTQIPSEAARASLRFGADAGARVLGALEAARRALTESTDKLREQRERIARLGSDDPTAAERLQALLDQAVSLDLGAHVERMSSIQTEREALEHRARSLPSCDLDLAAARSLALPARSDVQRLTAQLATIDARRGEQQKILDDATSHLLPRQQELRELLGVDEVPDPQQLDALRATRQSLWQALRPAILDASLDRSALQEAVPSFERAAQHADDYADRLTADGQRVGQVSALRRQIDADEERIASATERLRQIDAEHGELMDGAWRALWRTASIDAGSVDAMQQLAIDLNQLREDAEALEARASLGLATSDRIDSLATALRALLDGADAAAPSADAVALEALIARARARRAETARLQTDLAKLHAVLQEAETEHGIRQRELASVEEEAHAWRASFTQQLAGAGCEPDLEPAAALVAVQSQEQLIECIAQLEHAQREQVRAREVFTGFDAAVAEAVADLRVDVLDVDTARPELAVAQLNRMIGQGRVVQQQRAAAEQQLTRITRELEEVRVSRGDALARITQLAARALAGADFNQLREIDAAWSAREQFTARIREIDAALLSTHRMHHDELGAVRAGRDVIELAASIAQEESIRGELEVAVTQLEVERDELVVQLDAVQASRAIETAIQQQRGALATIERIVPEYRSLALQEHQLAGFLRRSADSEMGPVLQRAGDYLARITCDAYTGLRVEPDASDAMVLRADRARDARSVGVDELSEGTRDQLFLALRLSSLMAHAESGGETMPLIVDDILLTFDDERAAATLALLGELSATMQVLFLTHHHRLVELAAPLLDAGSCALVNLDEVARAPVLAPVDALASPAS